MGHDEGTPLVATYKTQRPPWIGLWSSREYKGRPDWWKEAGVQDDVVRSGKLRMIRHRYKEEDPVWYDPKVPDGTSNAGPLGLDSKRHPNITIKSDQPGKLEDFQDKVYRSSHQYKAIAEKFDLSKEHPGLAVNPALTELRLTPKHLLGRTGVVTNRWYHFGPRFFDKPLNEAAHEKGLALAKYTAMLMIPYTMFEIKAMYSVPMEQFRPRNFVKRYFQLMPKPTAVAFTWGFALSAASTFRNKDDVKNHLFASAAVGAVIASMKDNIPLGITYALVSLVLGTFWQYNRVSEGGIHGLVSHPASAGLWGGPLIWKSLQWGDAEVPQTRF
ncbi:unnamed protein product [Nippostrongylus brasiliensis]|uniref:NADH-ubiquinone oxidoreductase subunit B14.7 n=1 Tax=Nippostrongylus brasiliensis TaxID=27835 RepID=A0A0N4YBA0_NIPBR|nr:hypothetical protein Q1695_011386 [Nippostrongylus brasiliensis]VDL77312.1 unnamed protein product [Nippostrongylus brasiliensis]